MVSHDGALHLGTFDGLLDEDLAVVAEGLGEGGLQLIVIVGAGDTDGGTRGAGLHKYGVAELLCFMADAVHAVEIPGVDGLPAGGGDMGSGKEPLCNILIHAVGACLDAAADVGDAREVQYTLNGAVLAVLAVQDGEDDVEALNADTAVQNAEQKAVQIAGGGEDDGGHLPGMLPAAVLDEGEISLIAEPAALPVDADGNDVVFGAVEVLQHRSDGELRDLMLRGNTAEQNADGEFFLYQYVCLLWRKPDRSDRPIAYPLSYHIFMRRATEKPFQSTRKPAAQAGVCRHSRSGASGKQRSALAS